MNCTKTRNSAKTSSKTSVYVSKKKKMTKQTILIYKMKIMKVKKLLIKRGMKPQELKIVRAEIIVETIINLILFSQFKSLKPTKK